MISNAEIHLVFQKIYLPLLNACFTEPVDYKAHGFLNEFSSRKTNNLVIFRQEAKQYAETQEFDIQTEAQSTVARVGFYDVNLFFQVLAKDFDVLNKLCNPFYAKIRNLENQFNLKVDIDGVEKHYAEHLENYKATLETIAMFPIAYFTEGGQRVPYFSFQQVMRVKTLDIDNFSNDDLIEKMVLQIKTQI